MRVAVVDLLLPWRLLAFLLHFISAIYVLTWIPYSAQVRPRAAIPRFVILWSDRHRAPAGDDRALQHNR